jgi:endonuclease/exonuclease/phosphatase (EEP) superfamily protein YafD
MDPQQRYCVECAARRGNGANPSSRYFAAMSKRARRPLAGPAPKPSPSSRAAAVGFFALLPLAVALGVMVGRSNSGGADNSDALLQALREQRAAATTAAAAPGATAATAAAKAKKSAKAGKAGDKGEGKVVAHTKNGDVHSVTDFHASKQKEEEDTQIVEEAPEQTGENYVKAQQGLPDVIVVGGEGGSAPAPSGAEP